MRSLTLASAAFALAISGAAVAGDLGYDPALDQKLELGGFTLVSPANGGSPVVISFDLEENGADVVGFSFSGNASGITDTGSWASDTNLVIDAPDGQSTSIGGFSGTPDFDWDFDGAGSTDDGFYESGPHLAFNAAPKAGTWTFTFTNDWDSTAASDISWDGVSIILHKIPAPGALALLGLAGVAGGRRRRA